MNPAKAVFIDRDGVIVDEDYYPIIMPDDVHLLPGAAQAIRQFKDAQLPVVVITNQAIIARGLATLAQLEAVHQRMRELLWQEAQARVDAIYYCPHHANPEQETRVAEFSIECECRKPKPGLLLNAAEEMGIDLAQSYMIGDSNIDILAGRSAGTKTILLTSTGKGGRDGKQVVEPDYRVESLGDAVGIILGLVRQ